MTSAASYLKYKSCCQLQGNNIYVTLFPLLCAVAVIAFMILIHLIQSQERQHPSVKNQDGGQNQSQTLQSLLRSNVSGVTVSSEDLNSDSDSQTMTEEGFLSWLINTDPEEATRVNQTELLEVKKKLLQMAPQMKDWEGMKYLKNYPQLVELLRKNFKVRNDSQRMNLLQRGNDSYAMISEIFKHSRSKITAQGKERQYKGESSDSRDSNKNQMSFKPSSKAYKHSKPVVPRIVHMIWFRPQTEKLCKFGFHNLISILSVHKFIKPDHIFMWHNSTPCGEWWDEATRTIPNIVMKKMSAPTVIFGKTINVPEHQADVARIQTILQYGGIYVDLDVVALKSWDSLLHYEATMGAETPNLLGSGVIIAVPQSKFISMWLESYKAFDDSKWNYNSCEMPTKISRKYPELVHVEWDTMHRPAWNEVEWLYKEGKLWDWSLNYCVHLWYRYHKYEHTPYDIKKLNTTMAEIFRYVYYGTSDLL